MANTIFEEQIQKDGSLIYTNKGNSTMPLIVRVRCDFFPLRAPIAYVVHKKPQSARTQGDQYEET